MEQWVNLVLLNSTDNELLAGIWQLLVDKGIITQRELAEEIIKLRHGVNEIKAKEGE